MKARCFRLVLICLFAVVLAATLFACSNNKPDKTPGTIVTNYRLTVENGTITDTDSAQGIFSPNSEVRVTASVPSGKVFSHWTIGADSESVSKENPYVFNIDITMIITAHFDEPSEEPQRYTLTVQNGVITDKSISEKTYDEGATVSVTAAAPATGKRFAGWTKNGSSAIVSTANPYSFTLDEDVTVVATYEDIVTYTVSVTGGYIGTDTSTLTAQFEHSSQVTVTAVIPDGKVFDGWKIGDAATPSVTSNPYVFSISSNVALTAVFSDEEVPITYSVSVVYGTITGHTPAADGNYYFEKDTSVTAVADDRQSSGETFSFWRRDGETVNGAGASYTFSVTADTTLRAYYTSSRLLTLQDCTVTHINGTPSGAPATRYAENSEITLAPTVGADEAFICWIDGVTQVKLSEEQNYVFNLERDTSVRAVVVKTPQEGYLTATIIGGKFYTDSTYSTVSDGNFKTIQTGAYPRVFLKADNKDGWDVNLQFYFYTGTEFKTEDFPSIGLTKRITAIFSGTVVFIPVYTKTCNVSVAEGNGYVGNDQTASQKDVAYGSEVTVTPKTLTDKRFKEWKIGGEPVDESHVDSSGRYTFTVWEDVALTPVYESVGTVTAVNGTIKDGGAASTVVPVGTLVTVVAEEVGQNRVFKGWFIGDNRVTQQTEYTFRVESSVTLTAVFASLYTVTVTGGTISVGGAAVTSPATIESGTEISVSATVPSGKRFVKWTSDSAGNVALSSDNPYVLTVSANTALFAKFTDEYTIEVENGTLSFGGENVGAQGAFIAGDSVTVTAKPLSNKKFHHWEVGGVNVSESNPYTFTVSKAQSFVASYVDSLTVTVYGSQGGGAEDVVITNYVTGNTASVTAVSTQAKQFVKWTSDAEGNNEVSTQNPYSFTVNASVVLYAQFTVKYPVTVRIIDSYSGNTLSDDYVVYASLGSNVKLEPTIPNANTCRVKHWMDSSGSVLTNSENSKTWFVLGVTPNLVYSVVIIRQYSVTVTNGTFSDNTTQKDVDGGDPAKVEARARNGNYQNFVGWEINGEIVSESRTYSFAVTEDTTISAKYGLIYSQKLVLGNNAAVTNIANYSQYYAGGTAGFVFPGLSNEENIVIQGVDYSETLNWMFLTGYVATKKNEKNEDVPLYSDSIGGFLNSVIFILDMAQDGPNGAKGKFIKEIRLSNVDGSVYSGHAGGLAVTSKNIFVSNDNSLLRLSLSKITSVNQMTYSLNFDEEIKVPVSSSYCTFDDTNSVLWVGEFEYGSDYSTADSHKTTYGGVSYTGWSVGYTLNENGGSGYNSANGFKTSALAGCSGEGATPDYVLWHDASANTKGTGSGGKVQGIAFAGNKIVVSRSWRRDGSTTSATQGMQELRIFANEVYGTGATAADTTVTVNGVSVNCWYLDNGTVVEAAPMGEDLATYRDTATGKYYVYVATESACYKYRNGDGGGNSAHPTDIAWKFEIVQ